MGILCSRLCYYLRRCFTIAIKELAINTEIKFKEVRVIDADGSQLGVLPIIAGTFGYLSTYSIIANLVVVPVFAIYYPILCLTNLFIMISPVFSFMLVLPTAMVKFTVSFSMSIAIQ